LEKLLKTGDSATFRKSDVSMRDLAALTGATGNEFAMFTKGGTRIIMRGDAYGVTPTDEDWERFANEGWKLSGHTHVSIDDLSLMASPGDVASLKRLGQNQSSIYNALGRHALFYP